MDRLPKLTRLRCNELRRECNDGLKSAAALALLPARDILCLIDELLELRGDPIEKRNKQWMRQCLTQKAKDAAGVR